MSERLLAARYLERVTQVIEGDVVRVVARGPRTFVHVRVKLPDGTSEIWSMEWDSPRVSFSLAGERRPWLRPGEHVTVEGNPGRAPSDHCLYVRRITRADRSSWSVSRPFGQDGTLGVLLPASR